MTTPTKTSLYAADAPPTLVRKRRLERDIIWGQPVFRAPELPNPRVIHDPLPFTAVRLTQPSESAKR
jgi:hypothetical protein